MAVPLISVVIPVYREGEILSQTIDSVLSQTFKEYEIILVNNNADKVSLSIIRKYAEQFPSVIHVVDQPVQGAPSARNKGLHESKGKYIAMLEGDDLMYPHRLETQLTYLEKNKGEVSLLSSYFDRVDWNNDEILEVWKYDNNFWMQSLSIENIFGSHPSTWFFLKETAQSVGFFNEAFNPRLIEDDEFNFKMFFAGNLKCIPESLIRVRMPSESYQNIKDEQATSIHVITKLDLFFKILQERLLSTDRIRYKPEGFSDIRAQWLREQGTGLMSYSNGKKFARKMMVEAIKEKPLDLKNWKAFLRSYTGKLKKKNLTPKALTDSEIGILEHNQFFSLMR